MPNVFRVPTGASQDTTARVITRSAFDVPYSAFINLGSSKEQNLRRIELGGNASILLYTIIPNNADFPLVGDKYEFILKTTADSDVNFSGSLISAGTLTIAANRRAYISFIFDGVVWFEMCRNIQP